MSRRVTVYVEPMARDIGLPFHVSAAISWKWDALQTARTSTTEQDLLVMLHGRDDANELETERPWLRVDIELHAALQMGTTIAMPTTTTWQRWSREALGRLENIERLVSEDVSRVTSEGHHAVLAWQGDPEIKLVCTPTGELRLESIEVSAFQGIDLPRTWDDPDREPDEPPHAQLAAMFQRIKAALYAWGEVMDHLT